MVVDAPTDWTVVSSTSPLSLGPGESAMRLLSLALPARAPKRSARVRLRAVEAGSEAPVDSASIDVRVQAVRELRLSLLRAPDAASAGGRYSASFAVRNEGNVPAQVRLRARSAHGFRAELDTSSLRLAPSEARRVRATVRTAPMASATQDHLTVRAETTPDSGASAPPSQATVRERTSVEIIPTSREGGQLRPRYPVTMRLQTLANSRSRAGQIELQGSGNIAGDESRTLEFFVRGPRQTDISTYGHRSRYSATYSSDRWTLRGGGQLYETTPLAAPGRFGIGGEVRRQAGNWTLGTYAQRARWGVGSQIATYAAYEPSRGGSLTASVVRNDGIYEGTLASVQAKIAPWEHVSLSVEPGIGRGRSGAGAGVRVALRGQHDWGSYRTRHVYADSDFPSPWNGDHRSSAFLRVRLSDAASLFGKARYQNHGSTLGRSIVYRSIRAGAFGRGSIGPGQWSMRVSGMFDREPFRDKQAVRVESRLSGGAVGVRGRVEAGRVALRGTPSAPFQAYRGQLFFRTSWLQFSGFTEYRKASAYAGGASQSRLSFGLSSELHLGSDTELSLNAEWRNVSSGALPTQRFASVDFRHTLPFGHTIVARGRMTDVVGLRATRRPRVELSYNVPIGIPMSSAPQGRTVSGRVVNAASGTGVEGVLVYLGDTKRFTDDDGQFTLPVPQEETAYLQVGRATVEGSRRVPMVDLPLPIEPSEKASNLVIPMRQSASLTAQVVEFGYPNLRAAVRGEEPEPEGGLGNLVLEARDEVGRERRLTNQQGRAIFKRLRPGKWTVRLVNPQLPDDRQLERNRYTVNIEPGGHQKLKIRVVPRRRRISVREGKSLTVGLASKETRSANETDPAEPGSGGEPAPEKLSEGQWTIVVASMSNEGRARTVAERYRTRLETDAFSVGLLVVELEEGTRYRVALGPFESARAAQRTLDEYEDALPSNAWDKSVASGSDSENDEVLAASPLLASADSSSVPMTGDSSPARSKSNPWTIVVASMSEKSRAETVADKYRARLDSESLAVKILAEKLDRETHYRVVAGQFNDADATEEALEEHEEKLPPGAWRLRRW